MRALGRERTHRLRASQREREPRKLAHPSVIASLARGLEREEVHHNDRSEVTGAAVPSGTDSAIGAADPCLTTIQPWSWA
jgi:hypothetical protein